MATFDDEGDHAEGMVARAAGCTYEIQQSIEELNSGDSIHVRDLVISDTMRVLNPADQVVCLVAHPVIEEEGQEAVDEVELEEEGEPVEETFEEE